MKKAESFEFVGYEKKQDRSLLFNYAVDFEDGTSESFREKIEFIGDGLDIEKVPKHAFESLLLMLGISYWKAYCPKSMRLGGISLSKEQADFWNAVYEKGLGEFFYRNGIDFRGLVGFPYEEGLETIPERLELSDKALVMVGGGKDSAVSSEIAKEAGIEHDAFCINCSDIQRSVVGISGDELVEVRREIDRKLLDLNRSGETYNGHVPFSAIAGLVSIVAAAAGGYRFIVVSNERSANEGNVEYLGATVNHQWSKSFEFERLFDGYVRKFISPDIRYFSLLRPLSELAIAKIFSRYDRYFHAFSSCNGNFRIGGKAHDGLWCGQCPKCAFVFAILSAYVPKDELIGIFGRNLFADPELIPAFNELLGIDKFKPFECVGTPEEMRLAFEIAMKKGEYSGDAVMESFRRSVIHDEAENGRLEGDLLSASKEHNIPDEFLPAMKPYETV